jgi:hypothetical protein
MKKVIGKSLIALAILAIAPGCAGPGGEKPREAIYPSPPSRSAEALRLSIELEKDRYIVGEQVKVKVALTNGTSRTLRVVSPSLAIRTLQFVIVDSRGRVLRYRGSVASVGITDASGRSLPPGKSMTVIYPITDRYGFGSPPTGDYTIKGIYRFSQAGTSLWAGEIESEILSFSIVEKK